MNDRPALPRVVVWQWGRFGAGPRIAALLAGGFRSLGAETTLSLSSAAEILGGPLAPHCELPVTTYTNVLGLGWRLVLAPLAVPRLARRLSSLRPAVGVCAMPGPLDLIMLAALRRAGARVAVIVHDSAVHPGDRFPLLLTLQRALMRRANLVIALSRHVAAALQANGALPSRVPVIVAALPPLAFGQATPPAAHAGPRRVLCFGRLRAYKGLDLLAEALRRLGARSDMEVRIVGQGPETPALADLRALPGVTVENRWVPEGEVDALLNWADIVVLPYREASQSGIAPTALAAGRCVVATRVGGLVEQVEGARRAILCDPNAASLSTVLARAVETDEPAPPLDDIAEAWRRFAANLLAALSSGLSTPVA